MLHEILASHAFVGFLGAFWWVGFRTGFEVSAARRKGEPWGDFIWMGAIGLFGGTSAAFAMTNYFAARSHTSDTATVAFTVGMFGSMIRDANGKSVAKIFDLVLRVMSALKGGFP